MGDSNAAGFSQRELIVAAHERAAREGLEATDDAMVVERCGKPVYVLEGERLNFKITVPEDVWLAEAADPRRAGVLDELFVAMVSFRLPLRNPCRSRLT